MCEIARRCRFSATFRHYKYFFHLDQGMDLEAMQLAASMLVGEHDFRNFCKMDALNVQSFTRRIVSAAISAVPWYVRMCGFRITILDIGMGNTVHSSGQQPVQPFTKFLAGFTVWCLFRVLIRILLFEWFFSMLA